MQQRRERLLRRLNDMEKQSTDINSNKDDRRHGEIDDNENKPFLHFVDREPLPYCAPEDHYQMSTSQKHYWDISAWLRENRDDLAVKVGLSGI